jgi:hypothetical protein
MIAPALYRIADKSNVVCEAADLERDGETTSLLCDHPLLDTSRHCLSRSRSVVNIRTQEVELQLHIVSRTDLKNDHYDIETA